MSRLLGLHGVNSSLDPALLWGLRRARARGTRVPGSVGVGFCWSSLSKIRCFGSSTVWWVNFGVEALVGVFPWSPVEEALDGTVPRSTGVWGSPVGGALDGVFTWSPGVEFPVGAVLGLMGMSGSPCGVVGIDTCDLSSLDWSRATGDCFSWSFHYGCLV